MKYGRIQWKYRKLRTISLVPVALHNGIFYRKDKVSVNWPNKIKFSHNKRRVSSESLPWYFIPSFWTTNESFSRQTHTGNTVLVVDVLSLFPWKPAQDSWGLSCISCASCRSVSITWRKYFLYIFMNYLLSELAMKKSV